MQHNLKSYVLIPDDVPTGFAINGAAHAGCCMALKWRHDPDFEEWAKNSFRKVTCKVPRDDFFNVELEFYRYINHSWRPRVESGLWLFDMEEHRIHVTESDWNDGGLVAVVFKPRTDWPKCFRKLELYR